jgi:hypothetical protein
MNTANNIINRTGIGGSRGGRVGMDEAIRRVIGGFKTNYNNGIGDDS